MRRSLVVGNWKMNGTLASSELLAKGIIAGLDSNKADIAICVPYVYLPCVSELVKGAALALGSQNIADKAAGAGRHRMSCRAEWSGRGVCARICPCSCI